MACRAARCEAANEQKRPPLVLSKGEFQIHSGYANLIHNETSGLHVYPEQIPFAGSLVLDRINFSEKGVLEDALRFGGKKCIHFDFIEKNYEKANADQLVIRLSDEATSFGSRIAGVPLRTKFANLLSMSPNQYLHVDFEDVPIVSSSFADEVFGKLFVELGPLEFGRRVRFENVSALVRGLIDKAILQRSATSLNR